MQQLSEGLDGGFGSGSGRECAVKAHFLVLFVYVHKLGQLVLALADKADIGQMYLGEIERGTKMPSLRSFIKIIEALDLSADYVLRDELSSGERYIYDEIAEKLKNLSPQQRKAASDILDAYIRNL